MFTRDEFEACCRDLFKTCGGNTVDVPDVGQVTLYDEPLIGFAASDDEIFERFRSKEVIGSNFMGPYEWRGDVKTVVSFFLPFSETVRVSNRSDKDRTDPSREWLYARIEGQEFIGKYMAAVKRMLEEKGISACVPSSDERFSLKIEPSLKGLVPDFHANSAWSERHAAYACGLGTFSLSRGLITEKGMAGRFASIIISEEFEPTRRGYTGISDYCIRCGICAKNCPANAISLKRGKNNIKCNQHVESMKKKYSPRYGCGKCQVGVPCEFRRPGRTKKN